MFRILTCLMMLAVPVLPAQAQTEEKVQVGGQQAFLHVPANARASAVLVPGRGGIVPIDPLLRNRAALNAQGIATLTVPHPTVLGEAVNYMRRVKEPVGLVGVSAGVAVVGRGIGNGAKPNSVVLISGMLMPPGGKIGSAQELIKSPAAMPRTLILHHRNDGCDVTPPSAVEPFIRWSGGKATVQWIGGSGPGKDPCGPNTAHGFMGADGQVVGAIVGFIAR